MLDDAIQVPIPSTLYQITGVNLYEADVATGAPPPATNTYALVGSFQPLTTATITASASGPSAPVVNSSGAGGNIAPDASTGLRYASIAFTNRNGNLSPTVTSFTSVSVDVPGDQLYMANIPIGPSNIINRTIGFTVADGTNAGPFFYIPAATMSANIPMTATVIGDNTTTTAFFNFTDEFLEAETSTDMTDRLRCVLPPAAVDVYYSPSNDRVVLSGVDGYGSGHYISLAADSESYYGDTSPIQVANGNGQRCICAREFQGTLFSLKERSGFTISPTATDPSTWSVQQRWEGVGPCGPRAVCVTNEFLFFIHRSGAYAYAPSEPEPKLMTKEIPTLWSTINWDYQHLIWCCVDEENKEIRIGLPVGNATVPNQTLTMNYMEGLSGPIHFSQYAGREVAMGAARKWSLDDIAGSVAIRCERQLPANASLLRRPPPVPGVDWILRSRRHGTDDRHRVYNDNGSGIECQYETTSTQDMMAVSMLGGVTINALGEGSMSCIRDGGEKLRRLAAARRNSEVKLAPFPLTPQNWKGYYGGARGRTSASACASPMDPWPMPGLPSSIAVCLRGRSSPEEPAMALSVNLAQINSAARGNSDLRETLTGIHLALQSLYAQTGTTPLTKVDATAAAFTSPPALSQLSVSGANGSFTVSLTAAQSANNAPIYQEISSSPVANFAIGSHRLSRQHQYQLRVCLTLARTLYWRLRSSYNQQNWSSYTVQPGAVSSGLMSSAAAGKQPIPQPIELRYGGLGGRRQHGHGARLRLRGSRHFVDLHPW